MTKKIVLTVAKDAFKERGSVLDDGLTPLERDLYEGIDVIALERLRQGTRALRIEPERYYTVSELATILDAHEKTIRRWVARGALGHIKGAGQKGHYHILGADVLALRRR